MQDVTSNNTTQNLICFILVRHTNNITNDKTIPSSVTVEAFNTSLLSTLTCFGPYRPSSEGTSILLETTITLDVLIFKIHKYTATVLDVVLRN
jgi:hypothetical protein